MTNRIDRLSEMVERLCSSDAGGRGPGTPGGAYARALIETELNRIGLEPVGVEGYQQPLPTGAVNLLARLPGSSQRGVILAAHYDHLGELGGVVYPGANDNAAGVAVMLECAAALDAGPALDRSVVFCAFDAEEPPNFLTPHMGSQWFVDHPPSEIAVIDLMVCLDLVGTALGPDSVPAEVRESIFVQGAETSTSTPDLIDSLPSIPGIRPRHIPEWLIPPMSDHDAFRTARIPWVFYTVGRDRRYHTPQDTPEHLDYPKMNALVDHLTALVTAAASLSYQPRYVDDGAGDEAAIATLRSTLTPLAEFAPEAADALELVDVLADSLTDGRLTDEGRDMVRFLVFQLEDRLA